MKTEIEREKIHTICPHCLKKLSNAWVFRLDSVIGVRYVYFCDQCQKRLGIFQQKVDNIPASAFTMGQNKIKHQTT